ncbi:MULTISPECIES: hypothetical protein [unclassified Methylobacterium]|uniref:hypothetical protein n=1 Tax=unclassified Methylobacterium TaxID=2615210 RepID=UPI0006F71CE0|nr:MULTISPECIES: hypothetical protein [unclassified Methylobacterium]KQO48976.1 hypothetical protein ASF24_07145 [Methylobacterium sp. Leaf86]KQO87925.1 hypothetical protein ASF32_06005 [Methylobacterium sp. Leaf91]
MFDEKVARAVLVAMALLVSAPAQALSMNDPLTEWTKGAAMDRMQIASRLGKSFNSISESFTAGYFLKCIDDVAAYGNAKAAKIEDAMRECVAARMPRSPDAE